MFKRVFLALFLTLGAFAIPAPAAHAQQVPSLDRILPEIRRTTPGTFADAQGPIAGPDGQVRYRIKWVTPDGRVIWFEVDARTGRIIGQTSGGTERPTNPGRGRN